MNSYTIYLPCAVQLYLLVKMVAVQLCGDVEQSVVQLSHPLLVVTHLLPGDVRVPQLVRAEISSCYSDGSLIQSVLT